MMKQIHQVSPKYIIIKASPTDKKPTFKGALIKENTWIYWNPKILKFLHETEFFSQDID